jgi:hypothetical protein
MQTTRSLEASDAARPSRSAEQDDPGAALFRAAASTRPGTTLWAGRVLSGAAVLFLAFDAAMKVLNVQAAVDGTTQLGYPAAVVVPIGLMQGALLALYLVPRTAPLGAVLWTGYLGGAVATHLRVLSPLLTHTLFPIYVAVLLWAGLWLRDPRVRGLLAPGGLRSH